MPPQSPSDRSVKPTEISFLTPYWSGEEMMRIHLASVRRFHPHAPILVSKRGGGQEEMERHRRDFGIAYWIEECGYMDAYLRLLERCETEYVCILDHDTVLLTALDGLRDAIAADSYDLAGIEEQPSARDDHHIYTMNVHISMHIYIYVHVWGRDRVRLDCVEEKEKE